MENKLLIPSPLEGEGEGDHPLFTPLRARGSPSGAEAPLGQSLSRRPPQPSPLKGEDKTGYFLTVRGSHTLHEKLARISSF